MKDIPKKIDGATVLYIGETEENLGYSWYTDDTIENAEPQQRNIQYLAICKYSNELNNNRFYLFACDEYFNCLHDYVFSTIEEALENAKRYYKVKTINWTKLI